ncbi:HEPN domain-containing protein [Desulfonatronospira sp.]|uniref:HEPN domain-containing protein n=1 Tax=Desulfonatronospira sp. TaxID=1962951 RepID=UPI0025B8C69F|nr:HEPN domain-containing protein [Desulfonatronospira sp.]
MTISIEKLNKYWIAEADDALRVADHLIEKGDYSYALFFGHLALEKLLKALCVDICGDHAPPIHNLVRLARIAQIQIDEQTENDFITITAFNIEPGIRISKDLFETNAHTNFRNSICC